MDSGGVSARWRTTAIVLAIALVLTCLTSGYLLIDQGVSYTYLLDGHERITADLGRLRALTPALAAEPRRLKPDVLVLLRRQNPDAFIVETDSSVSIDGLEFLFDSAGTLKAVGRQ